MTITNAFNLLMLCRKTQKAKRPRKASSSAVLLAHSSFTDLPLALLLSSSEPEEQKPVDEGQPKMMRPNTFTMGKAINPMMFRYYSRSPIHPTLTNPLSPTTTPLRVEPKSFGKANRLPFPDSVWAHWRPRVR